MEKKTKKWLWPAGALLHQCAVEVWYFRVYLLLRPLTGTGSQQAADPRCQSTSTGWKGRKWKWSFIFINSIKKAQFLLCHGNKIPDRWQQYSRICWPSSIHLVKTAEPQYYNCRRAAPRSARPRELKETEWLHLTYNFIQTPELKGVSSSRDFEAYATAYAACRIWLTSKQI